MVREVTERHTHREHYQVRRGKTWYGEEHVTDVPSLLQQLQHASPSGQVEQRDDAGYASRPAARLEALDTMLRIDQEAARWVRGGHDDPGDRLDPKTGRAVTCSGTLACILLHSLTPALPDATRRAVTRDVRRWWTLARIATGWDSPAWRPDNTCPMCGERRTLQITLVAELAVCSYDACRETWDRSSLGLLADHIRSESEAERLPVFEPVPCMCRIDGLPTQGSWGSARDAGRRCV